MLPNTDPSLFLAVLAVLVSGIGLLGFAAVRRLRQNLQQSEERFRAISTYTHDWEIWLGVDGKPLWVNAAASRITGYPDAAALKMSDYPLGLVEEEDRPAVQSALTMIAGGGIVDDQLFRLRRRDSTTLWASLSGQQIFSGNGTLLGTRLSIRDVSVLLRYQQDFQQQQALLQSVLSNTSDAILALDQEFRVIFFNNRFLALWEISRDFLREKPTIQDLIREVCRAGLYLPEEVESLIQRRLEHLGGIGDRVVLETPRRDGVIVEGFAAPLPEIGYLLTYRDVTAQTLAVREMQRSREHYRTLIETVPHGIIECALDGRIRYVNAAYGALIGITPQALHGTLLWDIAGGKMRERLELSSALSDRPKAETIQKIDADGRSLWLRVDWNLLHDETGEPFGYLVVVTDITELQEAEQKERQQAVFVQTILDTIPAPIFYKDVDGRYLGCNATFERYLGKTRADVVGKSVFDLAPPDLARIYRDADQELLRQGGTQSYETQVAFADGRRHDVLFSKAVFYDEDGAPGGLVGAMLDISARKQAELALQESESRYKRLFLESETIFNGIPDSLTVWSKNIRTNELRLVWANRNSAGHFGVPAGDLAGKSCQELCAIYFEHDADCLIRRCFASETFEEGIRKTRDNRIWGVKAFPLRNAAGVVDRVIRVASDLTERMNLREEAARAAHLAALGELAAGVAHEINNPTSLILLEMPILQEVFRDSLTFLEEHYRAHGDFLCGGLRFSKMREQAPAMLAEILDGAERIKQIVEELRDFSHPTESRQFTPVDLNEVVRKALSLVGNQVRKATNHFAVTYAPQATRSFGSLQRLEQVVINLVVNACQALPSRERGLRIEIGSWPERRRNFIRIADTGVGILPEHLALITDPFFTTRRSAGGTGLGLSVSTRIIEEHGGTLHFASVVGEGTTVTVELPLAEKEDPA